ncbi:EAL domain-containing protein [Polymorphobacter sp. PAMC 29334]|uniref:putative bifunctional diguanylate cyclase/phosphodiesterase n=1 Tax=Polymorphobacter sp. PAMC 29334 TaxID=2862331 RepID=UPI001C76BE3B|nr:EAL domain-containing protein [Polymorphobacter sp. PAMC 29334]QYE35853.1 EAL domain-containing protein [Polymorphobacter sp. PAMC 29334]
MFRQRFTDSLFHWKSDDNLLSEKYRTLLPQRPMMYLAVFINILFLDYVSAPRIGSAAYILPIVVCGVIAVRVILLWSPQAAARVLTVAQMRSSMTATLVVAFAISIILSAWGAMLAYGDGATKAYVSLFAVLCTISCAVSLSSLPLAAYIVVAIGTIPLSIALLSTGDTMLASMGANILLVSPLVISMIYRQDQQLRRMVETRSDIAYEKMKVSDLAYRDSLTGLANRLAFLDALKMASSVQPSRALAIGMVDLDGFKVINDTYGHRTGDELLVETAQRFQRLDMGDAVIARLGGDEFAVLLRDVGGPDDAQRRLVRIANAFDEPFVVGGHVFRLRASIGLAHDVSGAASSLSLINRADLAMYEAKRAHSSDIYTFEPEMEARTRRRIMVEQALASPVENDLITLNYQPIVDAANGRIMAFEALARWTHPELGVIPPAEFIPLAEQAGITSQMTMHLLSMALRAASAWPADVGLSFNLSAAELNSPSIASRILTIVSELEFEPGRLSIEVTETALLSDFVAARAALSALQRGGLRILLDDFGAGYASIGYLREINFDGIKLDGSLIASLIESPAAHDLLVGVLHLCRAIGAPVTAEMVESAAQHDLLRDLGVQKLQGHFLSRALTADDALQACTDNQVRTLPVQSSIVFLNKRESRKVA